MATTSTAAPSGAAKKAWSAMVMLDRQDLSDNNRVTILLELVALWGSVVCIAVEMLLYNVCSTANTVDSTPTTVVSMLFVLTMHVLKKTSNSQGA